MAAETAEEKPAVLNEMTVSDCDTQGSGSIKAEPLSVKMRIDDLSASAIADDSLNFNCYCKPRTANILDICFCIDGTGSMRRYFNSIADCIEQVAYEISEATGLCPRFALVVYRDYGDSDSRCQVTDFMAVDKLKGVLANVVCEGGGDDAEDCFRGLWAAASEVPWKAPSRMIVWFGDCPEHGEAYNGGVPDDFPEGDLDGRTSTDIFQELQKRHIQLMFCGITSKTTAMTLQLKQESLPYGVHRFLEYTFGGISMSEFLINSIHGTVSSSESRGFKKFGPKKPCKLVPLDWVDETRWGPCEEVSVISSTPFCESAAHPLLDLLQDGQNIIVTEATCCVTNHPFANGELRMAYGIQQCGSEKRIRGVIKESLYEGVANSRQVLADQAKTQTVAAFLAKEFTAKLQRLCLDSEYSLEYVPVKILRFPNRPKGKNYFTFEKFLYGKFEKFSNNCGYVNKRLELLNPLPQTFSHFTHSYTNGKLLISDIQGTVSGYKYSFTDPAIHTLDLNLLKDITNLGRPGMDKFFKTHICNHFCMELGLKDPREVDPSQPMDESDAWQIAAAMCGSVAKD